MKIEIVREKRRTIVLRLIDAQHALLKVPKSLSEKSVKEFLDGKKKWLEDKAKTLSLNETFSKNFDLKDDFFLFGERVSHFDEIIIGFSKLSERNKAFEIRKVYLSHFANLEKIAQELSAQTGFAYEKVKPLSSVRIWGSFSSTKVMKLNWKLLILPEHLIRYVIYHELCHSKHMNHKPQFWREVERFCPSFKSDRKELEKFSFVLKADF